MNQFQQWLKNTDACEYARISKRTLYSWRKNGLKFSKLPSGMVLYKKTDIDAFLERFVVSESQVEKISNEILTNF